MKSETAVGAFSVTVVPFSVMFMSVDIVIDNVVPTLQFTLADVEAIEQVCADADCDAKASAAGRTSNFQWRVIEISEEVMW